MAYTFKKNSRGYSNWTFPFMRKTIIPATDCLFRPRMVNPENMPLTGPCFIYGNHSNYFDPFMLNMKLQNEPTAGVMTRDQFHKTIPRLFMDSIGIVPTSKYVPEPGVIRQVLKMIDQQRMIVIFPEGGRRWDGRPKPLIEATLKLFWKMGIPIHPVRIHGSYLSWPRWARVPRQSSVDVHWLNPLHASDFPDFETFSETCKQAIRFNEYDAPSSVIPTRGWSLSSGIERLLYRCPETGVSDSIYSWGGDRFSSRTGSLNYRMDLAGRLHDTHGEVHSLIDLYDRMRALPMDRAPEGHLLEEVQSTFYTLGRSNERVTLGEGAIWLYPDGIRYRFGSTRKEIDLENLYTVSVEQARKISLTTPDGTLQFTLTGSALQWQHYIRRLQKGEM